MDFIDALKAGGASATIILIVGIAVKLIQMVCGHRLRSECCGHSATMGVALEDIYPPTPQSAAPRPAVSV
jgi:hypothetical protein